MGRLRDKVILITGGAGAVGSAVAEAVVRNGGIAIDTDLDGREGIDHVLDVTSETDWQRGNPSPARHGSPPAKAAAAVSRIYRRIS